MQFDKVIGVDRAAVATATINLADDHIGRGGQRRRNEC